MPRNICSAFFEIRFPCGDNLIALMPKTTKFTVAARKCLGNPNEIEFRKNGIYISRHRSSLLFKTKSSSLPLRQSEKSVPYEDHHFGD